MAGCELTFWNVCWQLCPRLASLVVNHQGCYSVIYLSIMMCSLRLINTIFTGQWVKILLFKRVTDFNGVHKWHCYLNNVLWATFAKVSPCKTALAVCRALSTHSVAFIHTSPEGHVARETPLTHDGLIPASRSNTASTTALTLLKCVADCDP